MIKIEKNKFSGIIPAFYACYDSDNNISPLKIREFTQRLIDSGVSGLYVGGSSGECIYHSVAERKITLENVQSAAKGKITVIAHVACNNTANSCELARHAQEQGVDAIASIPPIYFQLPERAIAKYWNDISAAAKNTPFIIYNIPQLAGVSLTKSLYSEMMKNENVIGVKNSSNPVQDIQIFKQIGGEGRVVFNGPDEQYLGGRIMGADGGIGGTYAVMPQLYVKLEKLYLAKELHRAQQLQNIICEVIFTLCSCEGNLYAAMKEIIKQSGLDLGGVRAPLMNITQKDMSIINHCKTIIEKASLEFCEK